MTARKRLVSPAEVETHIALLRRLGIMPNKVGAVDIRADGVTIYAPTESGQSAYDRWLSQDADRDRA